MGFKAYLIFLSTLIVIHYSYGCQMDSVPNWLLPQHIEVLDIFRGEVFASNTATITGINTVSMSPQLNRGPYFDFVYADSRFLIRTNDAYADYEEYETEQSITATVVFNCEGSTTRPMVFVIDIKDTNNNDPLFRPSTELEFTVIPPLPPGFQITGCWNDIYARDIDLTTQRVDFEIFDSTYFAIAYDQASSTVPKEFRASLTTTTFIRSIPEPIEFRISATDVDLTGDPRRTTFATIRIKSDGEFELPDEPVFSQTFYRGTYTEDHQVVLQETISLRQGYHEEVQFSLGEEYSQYFSLTNVANQISIHVDNQLPAEILIQQQIILVVNAERTHTSGASTTVILQLPEEEVLVFQQSSYAGSIVDNALQLSELILTQGYSGDPVTVQIISEYASYFSHTVQQNRITLAMTPLPATVIEQNNFLNLQVVASTTRNSASTIVTLEIVKDDGVTPVFQRNLYEGTYDSEAGLSLEQIVLVQGYDATVQANLQGEHAALFQLIQDGPNFNLRVSSLPTELFREANLLLTLEATKPRTVGANTAISIALPAETQLEFERQNYEGIIEDNVLQLTQLILTQGYDSDTISVRIQDGPAHASYFTPSIVENRIAISMTPLPANIIQSNTFLNLEVVASTDRSTASAIVTLEIISDDAVTPVFQHALYEGTYNPTDGLTLGQIVLVQGFDETVRLNLQGEHASHFQIDQNGVNINLRTTSLPSELFRESTILLTLEATKPRTVGANTAISITLPAEIQLEFEQQNYKGVIEDNVLELTQLILRQGYENEPVSVRIQDGSAHASYFTSTIVGNRITLTMSTLPADIIQSNAFLNLEVVASTDRSSASTIVTLEIISDDVITPVFERGLYEGTYDPTGGLTLNEIVIVQGFDATVQLNLTGEHANLFGLVQEGGTTSLSVNYVPAELFRERNILLTLEATKPRTVGANAAISIALPTDRELRFAAETYRGTIRDDDLTIETIVLNVGYDDDVIFTLSGDYIDYFIITSLQNQVSLVLLERPQIAENNILPITLTASAMNAISTSTTIILEIIQDDTITPQFARNIYFGKYTETSNVEIEPISLIQGFDETVSFHLDGEHSQYFEITIEDNTVLLTLHSSIPSQVIYDEKVLTFSILAERELTVGAAAAISISFPTELTHPTNLRFSKNIYVGEIENNYLYLENIILKHGFTASTEFTLTGEYSSYFTFTSIANVVTISAANVLPSEVLNQKFITLELAADGLRAIPSTTVIVIDVKQPVIVPPVFNEAYYRGIYTVGTGLQFEEEISLSEAFDTSVSLELIGAHSQWFELIYDGLVVTITTRTGLPQDVLENNHNLLFTLVATRPGATSGIAVIFIDLPKEVPAPIVISFTQASFVGQIVEGSLDLPPVTLNRGYDLAIQLIATGEFASYFTLIRESNVITIRMNTDLPSEVFDAHAFVVLDIEASYPEAVSGHTTVVIELTRAPSTKIMTPVFEQAYYIGQYSDEGGLLFEQTFRLIQGFDETVSFTLIGDNSQAFDLVEIEPNAFTLSLREDLTENLNDYRLLVFSVVASKPGSLPGHAAIVITLTGNATDSVLSFDRINYVGTIEDNSVDLGPITLSEGFTSAVTFTLHGDLTDFFSINTQGALVTIVLQQPIPQDSIPANRVILLELQATAPPALPAFATIVLEVLQDDDNLQISPVFAETFYVGSYSASGSFVFDPVITLAEGYDQTIVFALEGEQSQWFGITRSENSVRLVLTSPIPPAVIANNQHLLFMITAQRPGSTIARATIVIQLNDEIAADEVLGFDRINYVGTIEDNSVDLGPITLSEGFTSAVTFTLHGDLADFFSINAQGALVSIVLQQPIPQESIPANRVILLELQATAPPALPAFATIVLEVLQDDDSTPILSELVFDRTYYTGTLLLNGNLIFETPSKLIQGYDDFVIFTITGDHASHFTLSVLDNSVTVELFSPLSPDVIADNQKLIFILIAERPGSRKAEATIIITIERDVTSVIFDRVLYEGRIQNGVVQHSTITISGYEGTNINLVGEYASLFRATLSNGVALVQAAGELPLPADVRHVVLELRVADSGAVLILQVSTTEGPVLPVVSFESSSYAVRVEIGQTGLVGRVQASADNDEAITYSLVVNNEHLRGRISINTAGELRLSAPPNSGVYNFYAVATTVFSQATGQAAIHLSVDAITICDVETVTAPLIIVDRDEEEPQRDLVLLNASEHAGCQYTLTNLWPVDQNWLYVDETGLHATAIDREDPSIAFMALSQIRVELILTCVSDTTRIKRSIDNRLDWLGPYDYGTNTWILGESIVFNPRRSIVNLIVNDINDNTPIFVGKENEPIVVGYPVPELEETVLPRSLVELQATDADVGINAALVYWSSEPQLAVSPTTGFVHVRNDQRLDNDQILAVNATDLNGEGLTGSITIKVKLLDTSNIAVITVRNAFLEDENSVLGNISNVIGYEVRPLRSVVISNSEEEESSRMKREVTITEASLEIYVYGLIQTEPVSVERLTNDINNAADVAVNIANIQSLQDHLDGRLICDDPGRDTGLLVATIVLSILLFILIVAIVVWFVLKRIKKRNYDEFSDVNSLASQNESLGQPPKPLDAVAVAKPRLNIEELKRSEKRLQDMLNAPVTAEPSSSSLDNVSNSVTKIPLPDPLAPIVIQDKLKDAVSESDDDEFGERKKPRRKSVVTFNENVEKIIHVDEEPDVVVDPNMEVYKL